MIRSRMKLLWAPRENIERKQIMKLFDVELGALVRARRQAAGMTQPQVAEKLKISTEMICRYETGTSSIDVATLVGLSRIIGFSLADVLESYDWDPGERAALAS